MTKVEIEDVVEVLDRILSDNMFGNMVIINAIVYCFKTYSKKDCNVYINSVNLYIKTKNDISVICEFNYEIDGTLVIQPMVISTKEIMDAIYKLY